MKMFDRAIECVSSFANMKMKVMAEPSSTSTTTLASPIIMRVPWFSDGKDYSGTKFFLYRAFYP